ncbi:MAG: pilus assembly protein PilM [Proteobacteria bacterium]|nr:pilus assembly protein PilM [Pseudomonadota bacterium]
MMLTKKYPIAFDIGFHDIHALQLGKSRDRFSIQSMFHQKLEKDLTDIKQSSPDLIEALKIIKKQGRFKGNRAVIHIPAHKVFSFPIEFVLNKDETMEEAIIREVEQNLPYPLEEAVIDYPSMTSSIPKKPQKVIIVSVHRSDVEEILMVFKKAGFRPDALDFRPVSSIRLHQYLAQVSDDPSVICYVGREESSVQIFNNDRILAMNKFPWGLNRVIEKLNVNLGFKETTDNARDLLKQHGIRVNTSAKTIKAAQPPDDPYDSNIGPVVSRIITPTIEELVFEFHKILGYIRNKEGIHKINDISFYGAASMITGLDHYIQNRMNIPAKTINILDHFDIKPDLSAMVSNDITPFAAALGLAMREISWL